MVKFKDLPEEIQNRMLDEQVRQGNKRDKKVFEEEIAAGADGGGFTWEKSVEGVDFWRKLLMYDNFAIFYEKYPK